MNLRILTAVFLILASLLASAADLVYLDTPQGEQRLVSAKWRHQFFAVQPYVETQQNLAFCGPASMAATLNSLDIPRPAVGVLYPYSLFTQDNLFTPDTQRIKSFVGVATRGMTLDEIAAFLNALGAKARSYPADNMTAAQLRELIASSLADPGKRVIVNFSRKALGQAGGGHQSPIGAYDEASDSVLVLDVAKFKYPPTWVKVGDLLEAMRTVDPDSGKYRGLVIVEKAAPRQP